MKVLAIESSCDDTSIAIVNDDKTVEFHETINHRKFHKDLGGGHTRNGSTTAFRNSRYIR